MITIAKLSAGAPKAKRVRSVFIAPVAPPSVALMAELQTLLDQLHPDDPHPDRHKTRVVAAVFNETLGYPEGFALADAWCSRSKAFKGTKVVRQYWDSLDLKHKKPVTILTLRWMVDQLSA